MPYVKRETRKEMISEVRPDRIPIYEANRNKITVQGLDQRNFMYRWVNDIEDRIDMFLQAQWELVEKKGLKAGDGGVDYTTRTTSAMSKGMGGGIVAYLMRIPMDIWKMDMDKQEIEENKSLEQAMRKTANENSDYGRVSIDTGSSHR